MRQRGKIRTKRKSLYKKSGSFIFTVAKGFLLLTSILLVGLYMLNLSQLLLLKCKDVERGIFSGNLHSHDLQKTLFVSVSKEGTNTVSVNYFIFWIHNEASDQDLAIYIPGGVYVRNYSENLPTEFIPVKDVVYVGKTYSNIDPMTFAIYTIAEITGFYPDGYFVFDESVMDNASEDKSMLSTGVLKEHLSSDISISSLNSFRKLSGLSYSTAILHPVKTRLLIQQMQCNTSIPDLLNVVSLLRVSLKTKSFAVFDGSDIRNLSESYLSSGVKINILNISKFEDFVTEHINIVQPQNLISEHAQIEVYNASNTPLLARRYNRKFTNAGLSVLRFGNASHVQKITTVYVVDRERVEDSLSVVQYIIEFSLGHGVEIIEGRPDFLTTGDIIVVLGEDMTRKQ